MDNNESQIVTPPFLLLQRDRSTRTSHDCNLGIRKSNRPYVCLFHLVFFYLTFYLVYLFNHEIYMLSLHIPNLNADLEIGLPSPQMSALRYCLSQGAFHKNNLSTGNFFLELSFNQQRTGPSLSTRFIWRAVSAASALGWSSYT